MNSGRAEMKTECLEVEAYCIKFFDFCHCAELPKVIYPDFAT